MDFVTILISFLATIVVYYIIDWIAMDRVENSLAKLPGPLKLPIVGTAYILLLNKSEDYFRFFVESIFQYGPFFRSWYGRTVVVNMLAPECTELILNNSVQIKKGYLYKMIRPWLCEGLLTSTGSKWHAHRKLITPTFHFNILENFMEVFVEKSNLLVEQMQGLCKGKVIDLYPYITRCSLDIICETAMGVQINAMLDPENEYVKSVYEITRSTIRRIVKPWLHPDFIYYRTNEGRQYKKYISHLHDFTKTVIRDRREAILSKSDAKSNLVDEIGRKKRKAFLDLFLEMSVDGNGFTDLEIREQVDTFMFEGHDTTTAAISWTLFLLGNYPKIQDKVYKEICKVFSATSGQLTINDLSELKLLERCIKEALRLYPSVPIIGRELSEDVQIGKYNLPAGSEVHIQILALHRNADIFPEPGKFDPDRFLTESTKHRHPYAYIPFSAGPRNCIGQKFAMFEEKTLLAYILKNYKITAIEDQETVRPMFELILRPKNGLLAKLEPR